MFWMWDIEPESARIGGYSNHSTQPACGNQGNRSNTRFMHLLEGKQNAITDLAPEIPEDLYHMIKKAVAIRKHLERNRKDKYFKFRLILVESRIHRLTRYYKKTKKLPPILLC